MEERREMNGQRMMTREELEMRLPAVNHIAEQGMPNSGFATLRRR